MNPWLTFSLFFLVIWFFIWILIPRSRKEMFWVSLFTMPFGLTEPLFVPEYWNPPSLFNLATTTGFDIESLIFCFAIGGIGSVLYESIVAGTHRKMTRHEMHKKRHRFHKLALASSFIVFLILYSITTLNAIYTSIIAMFVGGIAAILCRPDLKKKIFVGSLTFLFLYFIFFLLFNITYPGIVSAVWNLRALSGVLIAGVPLEELLFALTFGMLWSSFYEHLLWYHI